jgi:hypothetical protein
MLPSLPQAIRLALLIFSGGLIYCAWLVLFARETIDDLIRLVRGKSIEAD